MTKYRTWKTVLAAFFLLYALSPLTYDLSAKSSTSSLSWGASGRSIRNASLYLVEVLYHAFSRSEEPESDPSPKRVLIRKNSAVQRGRFDLVPQSGRIAFFAAADLTARQHFSIEGEQAEITRSWPRKSSGCLPVSSGLSPPTLS